MHGGNWMAHRATTALLHCLASACTLPKAAWNTTAFYLACIRNNKAVLPAVMQIQRHRYALGPNQNGLSCQLIVVFVSCIVRLESIYLCFAYLHARFLLHARVIMRRWSHMLVIHAILATHPFFLHAALSTLQLCFFVLICLGCPC